MAIPCLLPPLLRSYLSSHRARDLFLAGVFTGFLPCGLVYAFLALASASGTMWQGGLRMALFGLGTAPMMVLTGWGGSLLRISLRRHAFRIAAGCIVLTGVLSIARGVQAFINTQDAICPLCR
jgi:sulfite exporter TauE/SafE